MSKAKKLLLAPLQSSFLSGSSPTSELYLYVLCCSSTSPLRTSPNPPHPFSLSPLAGRREPPEIAGDDGDNNTPVPPLSDQGARWQTLAEP